MALIEGLREGAMQQIKLSVHEDQAVFLNNYKYQGFKDKSTMMREALNLLKEKRELQRLQQSADLYAETYDEDSDLRALTDSAAQGWPE